MNGDDVVTLDTRCSAAALTPALVESMSAEFTSDQPTDLRPHTTNTNIAALRKSLSLHSSAVTPPLTSTLLTDNVTSCQRHHDVDVINDTCVRTHDSVQATAVSCAQSHSVSHSNQSALAILAHMSPQYDELRPTNG